VRLVVINADPPGADVCSVQTDNVRGGYLAAAHLLEQGRRRLLFAGSSRFPAVVDRLAGARLAVTQLGGDARLEVVETPAVTIDDGHAVAALVDDRPEATRPDAVLAGADMLALGVVQGTFVRGRLRVPQDLAVIGYDNNREAWGSTVPITTLDQAGERMGRTAAAMLVEELRTPLRHEHRRMVLEPFLVAKQSTLRG
jgi:LacI family transcriptional regulator